MNETACDKYADQLVEYADGDLPAAESAAVAEHLAACASCRETVAALRRSLEVAGAIWEAGEAELAAARYRRQAHHETEQPRAQLVTAKQGGAGNEGIAQRLHLRPLRAAFMAASIVLLVGASLVWLANARTVRSPIATANAQTVAEMRLAVERAGAAMQMLGAAEYLSEQAGGQEIAQERFRYIIATYPETAAAAEARSRLGSSSQRRL